MTKAHAPMRDLDTLLNARNSEINHELISLLIQYHLNELPESASVRIGNIISTCKECQNLYEEISEFFNMNDIFMYQFFNEERINDAKQKVMGLYEEELSNELNEEKNCKYERDFDLQSLIDGNICFCCD
jgi:hypothetical protein